MVAAVRWWDLQAVQMVEIMCPIVLLRLVEIDEVTILLGRPSQTPHSPTLMVEMMIQSTTQAIHVQEVGMGAIFIAAPAINIR